MTGSSGRGTSVAYLPLRGTSFDGMKAGEEKWLVFENFAPPSGESTYPGKPGMSKRTLEEKLALARRFLEA